MSEPPRQEPLIPRTYRLGQALLACGVVQIFVCHLLVQQEWSTPYSWSGNNISDLGNVGCGQWGPDERYVCSPWHELMNVSFVVLGVALALGLMLVRRALSISRTASALLAAAGVGFVVAGLVPADVDEDTHVLLGAVPIFLGGNAGLLLTGVSRRLAVASMTWRIATIVVGIAGLVAVVLFMSGTYAGLGMGGMERVAALTMPIWLAATAVFVPAGRMRTGAADADRPTAVR